MHITYKFTKSILPLNVRLGLDPLIGVAHHGDEEIDEHDHGHQHVDAEGQLEETGCPLGLILLDLELAVGRLTKDGEEEVLEREHRIHFHCNQRRPNGSLVSLFISLTLSHCQSMAAHSLYISLFFVIYRKQLLAGFSQVKLAAAAAAGGRWLH